MPCIATSWCPASPRRGAGLTSSGQSSHSTPIIKKKAFITHIAAFIKQSKDIVEALFCCIDTVSDNCRFPDTSRRLSLGRPQHIEVEKALSRHSRSGVDGRWGDDEHIWRSGTFTYQALHEGDRKDGKDLNNVAARKNKSTIDHHRVQSWPGSKKPKSVLYVSFGSLVQTHPW